MLRTKIIKIYITDRVGFRHFHAEMLYTTLCHNQTEACFANTHFSPLKRIQNCKQKKLDTSHLTITKVLFFSATKVGQKHLTLYNLP